MGIGLCLLLSAAILSMSNGLLSYPDTRIKAGEIDLSGKWKISFEDKTENAAFTLDDSSWCLIGVPNPVQSALYSREAPAPNVTCPAERYPISKMRHHTYWYRTAVSIPQETRWQRPALFLGAIKHEAEIFWDGKPISRTTNETDPAMVTLSQTEVTPGVHVLAVRATSRDTQYPGIVHAYPRRVALGEYLETLKTRTRDTMIQTVEPVVALSLQFTALALLLFFVVRSQDRNESFFWLILYFGTSAIYVVNAAGQISTDQYWLLERIAILGMSCALAGYGARMFHSRPSIYRLTKFGILSYGAAMIALQFAAYLNGNPRWLGADFMDRSAIWAALVLILYSFSYHWLVPTLQGRRPRTFLKIHDWLTLSALLVLHCAHMAERIMRVGFIHTPLLTSLITVLVIAFSVEDYVTKQKDLSFFGRFVRKGLKDLLIGNRERALKGEKLLQGKKVVLLKLDIIGHTDATYGMPYGIKRIFQDCWFTEIDRVVAEKAFMDKPEGDGSIYFFEDVPGANVASEVLTAALAIKATAVPRFDLAFKAKLRDLLRTIPELKTPAQKFIEEYERKTGTSFWQRKTNVRFVLISGFVDEGLWGMVERGHYGLEGDLITLAARLEKKASYDAFVATPELVKKVIQEGVRIPTAALNWEEEHLKGIGPVKFATVRIADLAQEEPLEQVA
ncbi:MAG: hypothetical protein A2Z97_07990 [Bdellovibrionales bacterium GWB1_52_6]|nr:MAG: hypothetical protein A2Z97_07990 [Bdellovibrionales bacterium GWB1_52_6]